MFSLYNCSFGWCIHFTTDFSIQKVFFGKWLARVSTQHCQIPYLIITKSFPIPSSLSYNTSVRLEQHECNKNDTTATQAWHEKHYCITITTKVTPVQQECNTNNMSVVWLRHEQHDCGKSEKNDFNNNTSEIIFYFIFGLFSFFKEFIILDFANFHQKIRHEWEPWKAINREFKRLNILFIPCSFAERFTKIQ